MSAPADPGLQAERTSLAWRRTAMAVAVGALVGLRVLPPHLGAWGDVVCGIGLLWSLDLALTGRSRYRAADALLRGGDASRQPGGDAGATVARTAAMTLLVGVVGLLSVAVIATRG